MAPVTHKRNSWISLVVFFALSCLGLVQTFAQDSLAPVAGEYLISGELGGNQVRPHLDITSEGGFVVWQDDSLDDDGTSIGAQRINASLSGNLAAIRLNSISAGNQEKPRVEMLQDGGAAFTWQSGLPGRQDVYLRIIKHDGTFFGPEVKVNQYSTDFQINPDLAILQNNNVIVVWDSYGDDGYLRGVNARIFKPDGQPLGNEFRINQSTHLNQRDAKVEVLNDGRVVVAWISERLLGTDQFGGVQFASDVMVRFLDATGNLETNEKRVNSVEGLCATPTLIANDSGGFHLAWAQSSTIDRESGWDVRAAAYLPSGERVGAENRLNTHVYGDQYAPVLAGKGASVLAIWTSLGQDGSFEGVFGRVVGLGGNPVGDELPINTSTFNRQLHPSVEADSAGRFLVIWASYSNGGSRFNLHAQRLAASDPLPVLPAPYLSPLSGNKIAVSWPELAGYPVLFYQVYVDGAAPITTTNQSLTIEGLIPGTEHTVRLGYRLTDGRSSNLSAVAIGRTWGSDDNFDGLPDDWQAMQWGDDQQSWPNPGDDSDGDGANNRVEFLAGTNPNDSSDVLAVKIDDRGGAIWLQWNARPGQIYSVGHSIDGLLWSPFGKARLAPDVVDTIKLDSGDSGMFRVLRER